MSVTFLSPAWYEAFAQQLDAAPPLPGESSAYLRLGQLVSGAPDGTEHAWTLVLRGGARPELAVGALDEADVVLVESYAAAWALACGERTAGALLEAGDIKIRGDARRLVAAAALVEAVAVASGGLREITVRG